MNGINPAASNIEYAQINGKSIPVIREKVEKYEGPLTVDDLKPFTRSPEEIVASWKSSLSLNAMTGGKVSDVAEKARSEMGSAINQFLDGKLSGDELSETFHGLLTELNDACNDRGYPTLLGLDKYGRQALAEQFHSDCRKMLLDAAVTRNNQEGVRYATNGRDGNWQYYNADWYYKSTAGVDALTDGAAQFCRDMGCEDFQPADRNRSGTGGLELVWPRPYDDFNGAWMARNGTTRTFLDPDKAPPEGFQWFCESGGKRSSHGLIVSAHWVDLEDYSVFHPDDVSSMRMWASYRDENGKRQRLEKIFGFASGESGTKNVAALMAFTGKDSAKMAAVNLFLKNIQVFQASFYSPEKAMDLRG